MARIGRLVLMTAAERPTTQDPPLVSHLRRPRTEPGELGNELTVEALIDAGRTAQAASVLRKLITGEPGNAELHAKLAFCLLDDDPDDAAAAAAQAAQLEPGWEWPQRLRAHAELRAGRPRQAVDAATEAVRRAPGLADAHCLRARSLLAAHRHRAAGAAAAAAVRLAPDDALGHVATAEVELARRRWRAAEISARRALMLAPADPVAGQALALALHGQDRDDEAASLIARAVGADRSPRVASSSFVMLTRGTLAIGGLIAALMARPALEHLGRVDSLSPFVAILALVAVVGVLVAALEPMVAGERFQLGTDRPRFAFGLAGMTVVLFWLAHLYQVAP
jgi:Flp pilus assembly protein TadD